MDFFKISIKFLMDRVSWWNYETLAGLREGRPRAQMTLSPTLKTILELRPFNEPSYVQFWYTVIIFLSRNRRIRAVKFRPKNFGRISFDLGEISPNQQILQLNNGRNSPKSEEKRNSPEIFEGEPQLRGFARFARKNIYCVAGTQVMLNIKGVFFLVRIRVKGSQTSGFQDHRSQISGRIIYH
jgi:hypothetical protein